MATASRERSENFEEARRSEDTRQSDQGHDQEVAANTSVAIAVTTTQQLYARIHGANGRESGSPELVEAYSVLGETCAAPVREIVKVITFSFIIISR